MTQEIEMGFEQLTGKIKPCGSMAHSEILLWNANIVLSINMFRQVQGFAGSCSAVEASSPGIISQIPGICGWGDRKPTPSSQLQTSLLVQFYTSGAGIFFKVL